MKMLLNLIIWLARSALVASCSWFLIEAKPLQTFNFGRVCFDSVTAQTTEKIRSIKTSTLTENDKSALSGLNGACCKVGFE